MSPGAILLVGAGVWVLCQVFGGDALGRLNISGAPTNVGGTGTAAPGQPVQSKPGTSGG